MNLFIFFSSVISERAWVRAADSTIKRVWSAKIDMNAFSILTQAYMNSHAPNPWYFALVAIESHPQHTEKKHVEGGALLNIHSRRGSFGSFVYTHCLRGRDGWRGSGERGCPRCYIGSRRSAVVAADDVA